MKDTLMSRVQCGRSLFEMLSHRCQPCLRLEGRAGTVEGEAAQVLDFDTDELLYGVVLSICLECSREHGSGRGGGRLEGVGTQVRQAGSRCCLST